MIDSNENPLGPCQPRADAISAIIPQGGRYLFDLTDDLAHTFAQLEGLNPELCERLSGFKPGADLHGDCIYVAAEKLCDRRSRL